MISAHKFILHPAVIYSIPEMALYDVKITSSLFLEVNFQEGRIASTRVKNSMRKERREAPGWLLELFRPYVERKGDPTIDTDMLDVSRINNELLKVLLTLKKNVPLGELITYKELGLLTGKHPRVVGMAMRKNPFPVIFPCHRVIARRGIGGYSQGSEIKALLIAHEGGSFPDHWLGSKALPSTSCRRI